jgi:hypothetical protein
MITSNHPLSSERQSVVRSGTCLLLKLSSENELDARLTRDLPRSTFHELSDAATAGEDTSLSSLEDERSCSRLSREPRGDLRGDLGGWDMTGDVVWDNGGLKCDLRHPVNRGTMAVAEQQ